jgi:hypothetical protein
MGCPFHPSTGRRGASSAPVLSLCTSVTELLICAQAMYQGVVKDEARILARAALKSSTAAAPPTTNQTPATYTGPTVAPPTIPLSARRAEYSRNLALQQSLEEEQGMERARKEKEAYEKDREEVRRRGL